MSCEPLVCKEMLAALVCCPTYCENQGDEMIYFNMGKIRKTVGDTLYKRASIIDIVKAHSEAKQYTDRTIRATKEGCAIKVLPLMDLYISEKLNRGTKTKFEEFVYECILKEELDKRTNCI